MACEISSRWRPGGICQMDVIGRPRARHTGVATFARVRPSKFVRTAISNLSFSTVNGSISLDLPDDVDADVDARWVNGRLETDLPLELIRRVSGRSARRVLGDGGPELNLRTVNGSIPLF